MHAGAILHKMRPMHSSLFQIQFLFCPEVRKKDRQNYRVGPTHNNKTYLPELLQVYDCMLIVN